MGLLMAGLGGVLQGDAEGAAKKAEDQRQDNILNATQKQMEDEKMNKARLLALGSLWQEEQKMRSSKSGSGSTIFTTSLGIPGESQF